MTFRLVQTSPPTIMCGRPRVPRLPTSSTRVIAPTLHCACRAVENTVGERSMGDARLNYDELTYAWFDRFLKGENSGTFEKMPRVRYFTMGINKWQSSDTWPPRGAEPMRFSSLAAARQTHSRVMARLTPPHRRLIARPVRNTIR